MVRWIDGTCIFGVTVGRSTVGKQTVGSQVPDTFCQWWVYRRLWFFFFFLLLFSFWIFCLLKWPAITWMLQSKCLPYLDCSSQQTPLWEWGRCAHQLFQGLCHPWRGWHWLTRGAQPAWLLSHCEETETFWGLGWGVLSLASAPHMVRASWSHAAAETCFSLQNSSGAF